jgi:translation initiation factor IF-2
MSDPATSGTSAPASPDPVSPAPAAVGATQPFGTFGSTRGSGLARGKRPSPATAPAANAASAGYQPSSIEVITSKSEYKNPFTGETSVASPASPEPVERVVNEPAPQAAPTPAPVIARATPPAPVAPAATALVAPSQELFPLDPAAKAPAAAPEAKVELKILPPEEAKRPAQSWESGSQPRRDDRPSFRPERREPRAPEPRAGEPREPRQHRDPRDVGNLAPRQPQNPEQREYREPRPEQPKKTRGFFAWLKGLFGGTTTAPAPQTPSDEPRRDRDGEYRQGRRRHRGGRGRQQNFNGPRDGQASEGGRPQGGEYRQNDEGGQRRRHRGGRGRFRDDRGGDPRADGQQGGGAI